jgi:sulfatase modifying factor 1
MNRSAMCKLSLMTLCLTLAACAQVRFDPIPTSTPTQEIESGAVRINRVDGAEMRYVSAGEFTMGHDETTHNLFVEGFYIQAYEVTNRQYASFLNANGNQVEGGSSWLKAGDREVRVHQVDGVWGTDASYEEYPVIEESWYGASAYCAWIGGRLPTEAEWEKAARGGLEGGRYPWGDQDPVCDLGAVNGAEYSLCPGRARPVGEFGANGYGLYDMAGNVWEWTGSCHQDYPEHVNDGDVDPESGCSFVLRGGCWGSNAGTIQVFSRSWSLPLAHDHHLGFRCVVVP